MYAHAVAMEESDSLKVTWIALSIIIVIHSYFTHT